MLQTLLQKRSNGYYYFRWVCPPAIRKILGKREIIKSLRTTSKIQALARAGAYYMAVDKLKEVSFTSVGNISTVEEGERELDRIRSSLYENVVVNCFTDFVGFSHLYKARSLEEAKCEYSALLNLIEVYRVAATNYLGEYETGKSIYDKTKTLLDTLSVVRGSEPLVPRMSRVLSGSEDLPDQSTYNKLESLYFDLFVDCGKMLCSSEVWSRRYTYELTQVLFRSYEVKRDKLDPSKAIPSLEFLPSAPVMPMGVVEKLSESLHFSALFEEFLAHKISNNNLSLDSQREYRNYFSVVVHFIGDVPVETITKRQIKECLTRYGTLGLRNRKPYNTMDFVEFVAAAVPEVDRVSSKTVGEVRRMLQGIFRYALDRDYIGQSPAQDLNMDFEKINTRGAYSKTQLNTLLQGVENFCGKNEWKKWVIRLGVYTGARAGEIAQLRVEDIKLDDDSGVRYLLITGKAGRVKTENALRQVPLHSTLISMGFLDYVASQKEKVFPDIKSSAKISKWFPLYRESVGVSAETDFEESLVFHSFRHSMVTYLRGRGANDAQVQQIVGHEKTGAGITDRYTQRIPIADLKEVIERFTVSVEARGE